MGTVTNREREVIRYIEKRGKASAVAVSKHLNVGTDYAALLCNSLARSGYVTGTSLGGYVLTPEGEKLVQGDPLAGQPMVFPESDKITTISQEKLAEKVNSLAGEVTLEDFDQTLSALFIIKGQLMEEELKSQVEFTCTVGREYARNHWGEMSVHVVDDNRQDPIHKSKLVKGLLKLSDPQSARRGSWITYTGRLPTATKIGIFADGGDKDSHYSQYQNRQEWFFVLDREAEELIFTGEYAGRFEARMRPLQECALVRKKAKRLESLKSMPKSKSGQYWWY